MDISAFNQLLRSRRSVWPNQFDQSKKVDNGTIREILTNATWAPNNGGEEPWHFTVFTGDGLKKLASFQSELYKQVSGEKFKEATFLKMQQNPLKASHVIAIGMKRSENKNIKEVEDIEAVACAVQNIYLSLTAYGIGGYLGSGGVTYYEEAKSFFGLGDQDRLLGFFYIGHIAVPSTVGTRKPLEEKVTWIGD